MISIGFDFQFRFSGTKTYFGLELLWTTRKVVFRNINYLFDILLEDVALMQALKNKLNGIYGQVEFIKKNWWIRAVCDDGKTETNSWHSLRKIP